MMNGHHGASPSTCATITDLKIYISSRLFGLVFENTPFERRKVSFTVHDFVHCKSPCTSRCHLIRGNALALSGPLIRLSGPCIRKSFFQSDSSPRGWASTPIGVAWH
ncbi:hypothetical protein EV356DRAFT_288046 [Viridothelium virens]|uniref:Uncharacterized protein n=1 Tax=Viridothelium virens TaxID=1048519 RepID=A0A6A6H0D3_VIRVR|nr:hypothetical protein EV356DRAFT_288046 [Viridothelium virens]